MGSQLYNRTTQSGTTFFQNFDQKEPAHQWQFYPVEDSKFYLLRTKASGVDGFLGTKFAPNSDTPGKTVPRMIRADVSDDSIYWNVGTFPDGTFFLSNKANKTTYQLTRNDDNPLVSMTSKTDASLNLPGQHLSFDTISAIENEKFSTVLLPSTATSTPTPSPTSSATSPPSGGLSPGAKAGIGVGAALAVLLFIIGGLFLFKGHRRNRNRGTAHAADLEEKTIENADTTTYEMPQANAVKYEAYGTPSAELQSQSRPAELPGEIPRR
ncbi:hypothetical protein PMIN07_001150 [Paraphaeosphaeria minitans]